MANIQEKLKLKRAPSDVWSIREQLCLASSVVKSGDQNWISVSRFLRSVADKDNSQTSDQYSQKSCALQYSYLMENADIPKRKKKEGGESVSDFIVSRLTQDRITELAEILAAQRKEYFQLRNEVNLLKNGIVSDEKLQKMWLAIEEEEEQKHKAQTAFNKIQLNKDKQSVHVHGAPKKYSEALIASEAGNEDKEKHTQSARSSLLTSLLRSPSSSTIMQSSMTALPTITSLLCSSPKVPESAVTQSISQLDKVLLSSITSNEAQEQPSASAPTLSMLLEHPSTGSEKIFQQQLQNVTTLVSSKNKHYSNKSKNIVQTRSSASSSASDNQIKQIKTIPELELLSRAKLQMITNHIENITPLTVQTNKVEVTEIIEDIEEFIKEEIKESSKPVRLSLKTTQICSDLNKQSVAAAVSEHTKSQNANKTEFLSDSEFSEISVKEISSSTSNIVEIIGATINITDSKTNLSIPIKEAKDTQAITFLIDDKTMKQSDSTSENSIHSKSFCKELKNKTENKKKIKGPYLNDDKSSNGPEINYENTNQKENKFSHDCNKQVEKCDEPEYSISENLLKSEPTVANDKEMMTRTLNISLEDNKINDSLKHEKNKNTKHSNHLEERKKVEKNQSSEKNEMIKAVCETKIESTKSETERVVEIKEVKLKQDTYELTKRNSSAIQNENEDNTVELIKSSSKKDENKMKHNDEVEIKNNEIVKHCMTNDYRKTEDLSTVKKNKNFVKSEKIEESKKKDAIRKDDKPCDIEKIGLIKIEPKEEYDENTGDCEKQDKEVKEEDEIFVKKENVESVRSTEEIDEEESILGKLNINKTMKTYSKKPSSAIDSEPENEITGETADYKSWKKLIMSVYNTLATHKYASIFLRPITEDQAPGYHSIIYRPMDLSTIKKNIDNGTIRSTTHFQRDVMLMFQNAIMFNKHNTIVYKMTLEMREECLQHMQIFVQAAGEASSREHKRRETRTATNISNDTADSGLKRKWVNITSSPHEIESPRVKKRKKSEND